MSTFMWLVFTTFLGLAIAVGFTLGPWYIGAIIGFFVGLLLKLITTGGGHSGFGGD